MTKAKKTFLIALCVSVVISLLTLCAYAYQLGSPEKGTADGVNFTVYCYRHAPNQNDISCEATASVAVSLLETRVYYVEYSKPQGTISKGNRVTVKNAKATGDSTISGTTNPTHVKGWMQKSVTTEGKSARYTLIKDYTFANHDAISFLCNLCTTEVDGN